ncbi:uncharacterized protein LOC135337523 [Halichondria panicea]|uniref:uncharacterized protein LOC135337523 n=1 Tax=Halichondria panicea TaxID=6063 RepID=UPI00312B9008
MKVAILILALVALTASVAYAAPVEETELEAMLQDVFGSQQTEDDTADETLLEKLMQQETAAEQDKESILAQIQEEQIDAVLQEFFAEEQVPAELQGWFKRKLKQAGKYLKKNKSKIIDTGIKYGLKYGLKRLFGG